MLWTHPVFSARQGLKPRKDAVDTSCVLCEARTEVEERINYINTTDHELFHRPQIAFHTEHSLFQYKDQKQGDTSTAIIIYVGLNVKRPLFLLSFNQNRNMHIKCRKNPKCGI